ncbi:Twitchin [Eumeta japonica]|uniref:Twitchin n=1 Tax=Eumeta variegata TaxID=151549 RepID=A0A4C1T629_EUMVA|nr:Twitchin [Eumeta japonica]
MGLEPNHKYHFRVRAENQYGLSEPLQMEEPVTAKYQFTVPDPPGQPKSKSENAAGFSKPSAPSTRFKQETEFTIPSPPGTPQVIKVGKNYVDLKWEKPHSDGGSRITGYIVERRDIGGAIWVKLNAAGCSEQAPAMPVRFVKCLVERNEWITRLQDRVAPFGKIILTVSSFWQASAGC